jgi:hypothetical protein
VARHDAHAHVLRLVGLRARRKPSPAHLLKHIAATSAVSFAASSAVLTAALAAAALPADTMATSPKFFRQNRSVAKEAAALKVLVDVLFGFYDGVGQGHGAVPDKNHAQT